MKNFYICTEPDTGRKYRLSDLTGPGGLAKGNPQYELMVVTRYWRHSKETMSELGRLGRIVQTTAGSVPQYKRYLDEGKGVPLGSLWDDIKPVPKKERIGYPTQKPRQLLKRILAISSKPDDIILDAFCGCGTALVPAQKLQRQWIGIDVSLTACRVMAKRMRKDGRLPEDETLWLAGRGFVVPRSPVERGKAPQVAAL